MEGYLIGSEAERVVLLGGYVLECANEDGESAVEVSEPITGPELRYEQLELLEI